MVMMIMMIMKRETKKRETKKRDDEKMDNKTKSNKKDTEKSDGIGSKLEYITELKIPKEQIWNILATLKEYFKLVGPGFMISVAYIDPGNYSVNISAGAAFRFRLLYVGLMANLCSIFFHGLCVRLGSVTGYNLAQACRAFLPAWLNIFLYAIAEISMIATDITEVVGTGIAVNLLIPWIPLEVGCALSILDVIFIRIVSSTSGKLKGLRAFEFFVMALVIGVVICFCIQLCLINTPSVGEVLSGYLPSKELFRSQSIYQACGILGATVMPHSLYLGSALIQPRLKTYDIDHGIISATSDLDTNNSKIYKPSIESINACTKVFITELTICLFIFALFVNSAILITAGSSLYETPGDDADLFGIHDLLSKSVGPAAGAIFAFALLLSGGSAAIICTLSGQMISSGALHITVSPWLRRLFTRLVSTMPSIIIAHLAGKQGLDDVLDASQAVLSLMLPFITAPLIIFTSLDRYMTVRTPRSHNQNRAMNRVGSISWDLESLPPLETKMGNSWFVIIIAVVIWLVILTMNIANLLGKVIYSIGLLRGHAILH
ncbi:Manganese transporter SMF1 [Golovinomyces cichoracearum]|uniref:Manganese transporter SMF1 n=1 Tax=Golovinomyces cichoracearum TaxID=62708 RepID=A0A420INM1_9PEZI|nr:Manganese transporter SMF1 [Golovinomyces cichoracearum]